MPTDKPLPFMVYTPHESPGGHNPVFNYITKTERVNPRDLTQVLTEVAHALSKIGRNEGDYIIQCTYKFYNPAGKGKTIHIPQYLIDHYKEKEKN
jgi:hypothetical protein